MQVALPGFKIGMSIVCLVLKSFPLVKSRDASQPEQAIEPSEIMFKIKKVKLGSDGDAADKAKEVHCIQSDKTKEVHCIQSSDLVDHADSSVKEDEVLSSANKEIQEFLVPVKL